MNQKTIVFFLLCNWLCSAERPFQKLLKEASPLSLQIPKIHKKQIYHSELYFLKDNQIPLATFQLILGGGSAADPEDKPGLTSFMAEMIAFSGSHQNPREELANFLEQRGSSFTVSCQNERCIFRLKSMSHFFLKDLEKILEVLQNPRFSEEDWQILQKKAQRSIESRKENPTTLLSLLLKTQSYPNHFRGAIVRKSHLQKINTLDFLQIYQKLLHQKNINFSLCGDFEEEKVIPLLKNFLSSIPEEKELFFLEKLKEIPPMPKGKIFRIDKDIPQSYISFRARGLPHHHENYVSWRLLDSILGGESFNSILVQNIRTKKGWAYSVYSAIDTDYYTGTISIVAQTENKNLPNLIKEIERLLSNPQEFLTEERLEESKKAMLNKMVFLYEKSDQFLNLYLELLWDGLDEKYLENLPKRIEETSLKDLYAIYEKLYKKDQFFLAIVGPRTAYEKDLEKTQWFSVADFE